jgi:predicted Fe-S protein YdhL (DUF1289 family)
MPQTETVESNCVKLCKLDARKEFCIGCGRSLRDIGDWAKATNDQRRDIISRAEKRVQEFS